MKPFTISYITNRLEPKLDWFFSSLAAQGGTGLPVNVIDFHANKAERRAEVAALAKTHGIDLQRHITPMPNAWQGEHRLTKDNYFAAATASNTAIAVCATDWIVFVDDLSVLQPGWLDCVREATTRTEITCGSYLKVLKLEVEAGLVKSFEFHAAGEDHRAKQVGWGKLTPCTGQWFFGCSFVAPVEALLRVNGFDPDCDSMGYQDTLTGLMLAKHGFKFVYDSRMVTYESEELHGQPGNVFHRWDPGISPNDKSHRMIELVEQGKRKSTNYYGPGGLRELRQRMLSGGTFPRHTGPETEWFTGTRLADLPATVEKLTHEPFERNVNVDSQPTLPQSLKDRLTKIQKMHGWCEQEKAERLAQLVLDYRPKTLVDLGVFGGRSLAAVAMACQHLGQGRCIGIDPWATAAALEGEIGDEHVAWWAKVTLEEIYQDCLVKLKQLGLDHSVEIWRMKDTDAISRFQDGEIDFLHSDSNHGELVSCRVTTAWHAKLRRGGIEIFDDCDWPTQAKAVALIKNTLGYEIIFDNGKYLVAQKQ